MLSTLTRTVITSIGRELGRIVLQSDCVICRKDLPWKRRVGSCCLECWEALPEIKGGKCRKCAVLIGVASTDSSRPICIECSSGSSSLDWIEAWGDYSSGLEAAIRAFKFEGHSFLAAPMADLLVRTLQMRADLSFDCVSTIPMDRGRLKRRGYNQALLLAREVAALTALPLRPSLLSRSRTAPPQSSLSRAGRQENARGAYQAEENVRGLSILLVDDVCTTGATLENCARPLMAAGAERVCAITLARASLTS